MSILLFSVLLFAKDYCEQTYKGIYISCEQRSKSRPIPKQQIGAECKSHIDKSKPGKEFSGGSCEQMIGGPVVINGSIVSVKRVK